VNSGRERLEHPLASVLVIDDEPLVHRLVHRILRGTGHQIVGNAADGESGLHAWRAATPDVVILDHEMAGMTGIETATAMLADDPTQRIVLFTASPDPTLRDRAETIGISTCLDKRHATTLPEVIGRLTSPAP
jgi:two-component system nitrate/nitrite response regulator NarL